QSRKPAWHAKPHCPSTQVAVALRRAGQAVPQPTQAAVASGTSVGQHWAVLLHFLPAGLQRLSAATPPRPARPAAPRPPPGQAGGPQHAADRGGADGAARARPTRGLCGRVHPSRGRPAVNGTDGPPPAAGEAPGDGAQATATPTPSPAAPGRG